MSINKLLDRFNDGDLKVLDAFGASNERYKDTYPRFLKIIDKKGLFNQLDNRSIFDQEQGLANVYAKYLFDSENRRDDFIKNVSDILYKDIEYIDGRVYINLRDISDLSYFFCDKYSRDMTSRELVNGVLSEEWYEPYSDTTSDVFMDVINDLNDKNIMLLSEKISNNLKTIDVSGNNVYNTNIPEMAENQGHPEYLTLTPKIVRDLILIRHNFDYISELLGDEFNFSLSSIHNHSYNQAYIDEQYDKIWSSLENFGIPKVQYTENKTYQSDITDLFINVLGDFLNEFSGYDDDISDYNSFIMVFKHLIDYSDNFHCLNVRVVDYPDYRRVRKLINEIFPDYLDF